jgi:hypothetical protein
MRNFAIPKPISPIEMIPTVANVVDMAHRIEMFKGRKTDLDISNLLTASGGGWGGQM